MAMTTGATMTTTTTCDACGSDGGDDGLTQRTDVPGRMDGDVYRAAWLCDACNGDEIVEAG
jgi:hypothetical protein